MKQAFNLKYFFLAVFVFIVQNTAFSLEEAKQLAEPSFDLKLLVAICAACGTLITAIVNLVRWVRERSAATRKLESISYALRLKEFINAHTEFSSAIHQGAE